MVNEVWRRMVPLPPEPRLRVEDEIEVVLVWADVEDLEQWMMKMATRTKIDDDDDGEEGNDLFDRCVFNDDVVVRFF